MFICRFILLLTSISSDVKYDKTNKKNKGNSGLQSLLLLLSLSSKRIFLGRSNNSVVGL